MEYDLIGEYGQMNLPNKLTMLRVIYDSVFCIFHADVGSGHAVKIYRGWQSLSWRA